MIFIEEQTSIESRPQVPTLAESERKTIEQALIECKGVIGGKNGAARLLEVPRSTLQYRIKKYNIKPEITVKVKD